VTISLDQANKSRKVADQYNLPERRRQPDNPGARMDESMLADLVRDYSAPLLRYVTKLLFNDQQLAEDIVQETFLRVWQRPHVVNDRFYSIGPWLFTVARNLVNDHKRMLMARPAEVSDAKLASLAEERDQIDETLLAQAMRQAMARLTPEHRAVLNQIYHHDQSFVDAAKQFDIPVGTVKSRIHYALRSLRSALDELGINSHRP
jgi:RNA polymerase sigma-70 factor (ECF subfamily)